MEILVTGGTGFLGRHVATALLRQGHRVRLLGRGFAPVRDIVAQGAIPVEADLRDQAAIVRACHGVDAVVHAGALSSPWGARRDFFAINVGGTMSVIAGCRATGVRRLVYVSSPSVVFDGRDQINVTESVPYPRRFASVYSETKKLGEDLVRAASGLDAVILRPKAIFGPGDRALLPRLVDAARAGRLPQVGNGLNLVNLTYVENVADAILLALDAPAAAGNIYTITNDEHVALWPAIRSILRRLQIAHEPRPVPLGLVLLGAWGMEAKARITRREPLLTRFSATILARTQTYDITAARRDLGYRPRVPVADGITRALAALAPV